ncbi:MAG: DEAD/DEAH box helicase, partial [Acidobacteriota bacterium]
LIRGHRSTMIFVNSRRLAERLAAAINEVAEEPLAAAHHGSIAKEARAEIEDRLKRGVLPAIVATSSLELGIDMGAVDLVIQIEAPLSVASGIQRIGRAGHDVGAVSRGVIFPKYRADLLACAAVTSHMLEGDVEHSSYPRNPLDVLAQQIVAMVARDSIHIDEMFRLVRRAAPFADVPRSAFEGVLDMLSGRYPSDRFAELKPRITWDRLSGMLHARRGARVVAVTSGGTIPDRGLFGVFLASTAGGKSVRVGELDEEMVFESRPGDVFLLGASSWRIEEITHERVIVSPAPGEPGRMPFWHGDRPSRPVEFGRVIGQLTRQLQHRSREDALRLLREQHCLDERAARNLMDYLDEQADGTGEIPNDQIIVLERFVDEVGDWCVTLLSPFGGKIHAPWAMAVAARIRDELQVEVDMLWSDDGIVFRLPEMDEPPDQRLFFPVPDEIERLVVGELANTALFAALFRENAARALLLPRRRPGKRTPLWIQRRRSADLLKVASDYGDFPIVLETYRECLRDVFDLPGLVALLRDIEARRLRTHTVNSRVASPFAASLMLSYVANFLYEGDAPLAERRAQALALDRSQLRELLGEPELRELLAPEAIEQTERRLQRLEPSTLVKHADGLHDLLLSLGELTLEEIAARTEVPDAVPSWLDELGRSRRIIEITLAGERRFAAAEDAGRLRDALGVVPPPGLPRAFLDPAEGALEEILARFARTHVPFRSESAAKRFGLGVGPVNDALERLVEAGRLVVGEFLPGGRGLEFCDVGVLRTIKQKSLAALRKQVEPVERRALARFLPQWQGLTRPRRGLEGLLGVIEQLQGAGLPASILESDVLAARVQDYDKALLDELCAAGEVIWRGLEPLGPADGRLALYLTEDYPRLAPPPVPAGGELVGRVRRLLGDRGALFFSELVRKTAAFPPDVLQALWDLVWAGEVTNDTLAPLRSLLAGSKIRRLRGRRGRDLRSRRAGPAGSEGRWTLLPDFDQSGISHTERRTAEATQLLERHGVLTREAIRSEGISGGFAALYPVLKAMEQAGRVRRGYFVAGLGATQFAIAGAEDRLRAECDTAAGENEPLVLSAADPANAYGAALPWPDREGARAARIAGARVILIAGELIGYLSRSEHQLLTFLPLSDPDREQVAMAMAAALASMTEAGDRKAVLITKIDGLAPEESPLGPYLRGVGFDRFTRGFVRRRRADDA